MSHQWPGASSPRWTSSNATDQTTSSGSMDPSRHSSMQARLQPLDTSAGALGSSSGPPEISSARSAQAEVLPSVKQLLATTPTQSSSIDIMSGSGHDRRWDSMMQSPASERSSAFSGKAPISDILSGRAQASPRHPYASFQPAAQYLHVADFDRRQSAPVRQMPPQLSHSRSTAQFPGIIKREATPVDGGQDMSPMFKNPFPDSGPRPRHSNSISPKYTPSPHSQPALLQPTAAHAPLHFDPSRQWYQETHPPPPFSRGPSISQASSQSPFGGTGADYLDTTRPGPVIQADDKFLPRFLREQYVPNEGLCYFYDDGSHCKSQINGEQVNPLWGVTKAGKPRKRLILACKSCRDKKIKCQPDFPKCVQCNKFGRDCRFTAVPRRSQASASSLSQPVSPEQLPPAGLASAGPTAPSQYQSTTDVSPHQTSWLEGASPTSGASPLSTPQHHPPPEPQENPPHSAPLPQTTTETFPGFKIPSYAIENMPVINEKRRASFEIDREELVPGTPLPAGTHGPPPAKRRRTSSRVTLDFEVQEAREHNGDKRTDSDLSAEMPPAVTPTRQFTWQTNPLDVDPDMVLELMDLYFKYFNSSSYSLFPRKPFLSWFMSKQKKSMDDLMLVYSMLAIATRFATSPKAASAGADFESVARNAVDNNQGKFTLQLIQSRILLGLYASSTDNPQGAWDYIGAAIHAAMGVRLFLEEGRVDLGENYNEFGLSKPAMEEVCRRTFWTLYIMDRFNGYMSGSTSTIEDEDIGLRLPCAEDEFEAQNVTDMPYFEPDFAESPNVSVISSPMGCLVNIVALWGQYLASVCRPARRRDGSFARKYEAIYQNMNRKLLAWQSRLPNAFQDTDYSILHAYEAGSLGTFATIQSVFHTIHMKLNCLSPHESMAHHRIVENLRAARAHATQLLELCGSFNQLVVNKPAGAFNISTPFTGYAIMTACDIIAARGRKSEVTDALRLMESGRTCLGNMKGGWRSCAKLQNYVGDRSQALKLTGNDVSAKDFLQTKSILATSGLTQASVSPNLFRSETPGMKTFAPIDDLAYTAGDEAFAEALSGVKSEPVQAKPEQSGLGLMLIF